MGLAMGHAYTVQGVTEVTDKNGVSTKLVRLRNPWGAEKYKGPWCDSCDEWTEETEKQAGLMRANDGVFYIPIDVYKKHVSYSIKNYNMDKLKMTSHLVLGDTSNDAGWTPWCGKKCAKHLFTVKSDTEQQDVFKSDRAVTQRKCMSKNASTISTPPIFSLIRRYVPDE